MALISHYKLDEPHGSTTAVDSVGGVNGVIQGGVALGQPPSPADPSGKSMFFDGVNDTIILPTTHLNFERTDSFSFSGWVKMQANRRVFVISKNNGVTPFAGFSFDTHTGRPYFDLTNESNSNRLAVYGDTQVDDDNWHNIIVTYDGSSSASGVKHYVDGVLTTNDVLLDTLSASALVPTANAAIGSINNIIFGNHGSTDDVRIYDHELNQAEVTAIFNPTIVSLVDDTASTDYITPVNIDVLANDTGIVGGETVTIPTPPTNGTAVVNVDGVTIDYTPDVDFSGVDTFTYDVDASGSPATVTVNVAADIQDDFFTQTGGTTEVHDILANDSGFDPLTATLTIVSPDTLGTATVTVDNKIQYIAGNVAGLEVIQYTVNGFTGSVSITVEAGAVPDFFTVTAGVITNLDVKANDIISGAGIVTIITQPANATVSVDGSNNIDYNHNSGILGADQFVYEMDGTQALVTMTVTAPPGTLVDDSVLTPAGVSILIDVLANDTIV